MCVCISVCICVFLCVIMYVHECNACMRISVFVCIYMHAFIYVCVRARVCMQFDQYQCLGYITNCLVQTIRVRTTTSARPSVSL